MTIDFKPEERTLLVLLGPTGVGKTAVSLALARHFNAPVVSSDSRQLFRELPIGTAAPTAQELAVAPHYFIGTHSVTDSYSAGQYEADAIRLLEDELFPTHPVVILSGGSMMYIDAVCKGLDDIPTIDESIRAYWQEQLAVKGLGFLQDELLRLDPGHYHTVDLQNYKRVMHALEVCTQTGRPYSELRTGKSKQRSFHIKKIGLNRPRPELYDRINRRVDLMIEEGLIDEARAVYPLRHLNSLNTVGYKELFEYFDGNWPLDFAIDMIKQDSRRYAKRQLTWFNRDPEIEWMHPDAFRL
ncbi:MAG: tRNA (adenosine(37)-N6)-dimethylallyltransferase MiaA [Paludibacter sp. 47-17]|nr:MAG: tRNA (adenosine(37)-N6)-dimethylallyltransferase MiaA [Paludibacter sp. SCN 50-10]OJX88509.1 MAG: tRNA (adenosine(37)-N6)-dimethylallyltransferase MiaA [Paludibacter sp. 47-17]